MDTKLINYINNYIYKLYNHKYINDSAITIDDLQQEGLLAALEAAGRYNPDGGASFSSWCVTNALRGVQSYLASRIGTVRIPRRARDSGMDFEYESDDGLLDDSESYIPDELYGILRDKCHGLLPSEDAELVLEYFGIIGDNDHTIRSLAEVHGIPPKTVHNRIRRSIIILQKDDTITEYYAALRT